MNMILYISSNQLFNLQTRKPFDHLKGNHTFFNGETINKIPSAAYQVSFSSLSLTDSELKPLTIFSQELFSPL